MTVVMRPRTPVPPRLTARPHARAALALLLTLAWHALADPGTPAARFDVDLTRASSRVEFEAAAWPTALLVHGAAERLEGRFEAVDGVVSGRAELALETFETGIALRDRHMRETYLETTRYPRAVLELVELRLPGRPQAADYSVKGQAFEARLTLHGVTRALRGTAHIGRRAAGVAVEAEFDLSLREFGIAVPSYLGLTVADRVRVKVRFAADLTAARVESTQ